MQVGDKNLMPVEACSSTCNRSILDCDNKYVLFLQFSHTKNIEGQNGQMVTTMTILITNK